jgi:hypothetical protein
MDSYYSKWLVPNKHYKLLRPGHVCEDLKNLVWWVEENDDKVWIKNEFIGFDWLTTNK